MTATATLSSKFQISIPKAVREAQHWRAGQEFAFIPVGRRCDAGARADARGIAGTIAKGADPSGYRDRKDRY